MPGDSTIVTTEAAIFFQNRYKSILCLEDIHLPELVRYIELTNTISHATVIYES